MRRSRVIGAIAAALIAGFVLGGVGISLAGNRTAVPVPDAAIAVPTRAVVVPAATTAVVQASSNATKVAPAPRAKRMMARAYSSAPRYQTPARATTTTTRHATTRSGGRYCNRDHTTRSSGWNCCW